MDSPTALGGRIPLGRVGVGAGTLATGVAVGALTGLALANGGMLFPLAGLATGALLVAGLVRPSLFLLAVLAVRPVLDATTDRTISISGIGINAAGLLGSVIAGVAVPVVLARRRSSSTPIALAGGVVLAASLAASALAMMQHGALIGTESVQELVRLASLGGIYLLALHLVASDGRLRAVAAAVTLSAVVPALYGLYQWASGAAPVASDLDFGRVSATFSGPNAAGMYFAVAALLLIGLPDALLPRLVRYASVAVTLAALIGTYSRTGWLLFVIGFVPLLWRDHKRTLLTAATCLIVLGALLAPIRDRLFDTRVGYKNVPGQSQQKRHLLPSSYSWRLTNWQVLLETYAKRPVFGYGLRTAGYVNPRNPTRVASLGPSSAVGTTALGATAVGYDPHNTLVKLLVEGGPLLVAAYALLLTALIQTCRRLSRHVEPVRSIGRTLWIAWIVIAIVAVTADDPPVATAMMMAILGLTGACEGAARAR